MQDPLRDENGDVAEQCLEKRVYYKLISGRWDDEKSLWESSIPCQGFMHQYLPTSAQSTSILSPASLYVWFDPVQVNY
jgi:hypothetical protein